MKKPNNYKSKRGSSSTRSKAAPRENLDRTKVYSKGKETTDNHGNKGTYTCNYDKMRSNDIAWYNKADFLYREAVRVPFDAITGAPRTYVHGTLGGDARINSSWNNSPATIDGVSVPGIMTINYHPTLGYSRGVNAPLNRAFTTIYGDIASKTTGALQFQQADLAMLVTSVSTIAASIACAKRALEVAALYAPTNYYYPVHLLTAMLGSESSAMDVISNRDLYRARVNDLVLQFNNLRVINFVDIFKRQYSLAHNVFADEDSIQAQLYVFKPIGYYVYKDTEATLEYKYYSETLNPNSFQQYIDAATEALNAWRNSSDLPLISGALIRAYPDNEFIVMDMVDVDSKLIPVHDRNICWQINNMRTAPVVKNSLNVTQDVVNNFLICEPKIDLSSPLWNEVFWRNWVYLNSYDHNESDEFVMESTRLIPYIVAEKDSDTTAIIATGCSEIVESITIYWTYTRQNGELRLATTTLQTNMDISEERYLSVITVLAKWKNGPRLDLWKYTPASGDTPASVRYYGAMGDLGDYTYLYPEQLQSLHEAALQSLYWVGSMNLKV